MDKETIKKYIITPAIFATVATIVSMIVSSIIKGKKTLARTTLLQVPEETVVEAVLSELSEIYQVPKPKYVIDLCDEEGYVACAILGPNILGFKRGKVRPEYVAHEFAHYYMYLKYGLPWDDEASEAYAISAEDWWISTHKTCPNCGTPNIIPTYPGVSDKVCPICGYVLEEGD